MLLEKLYYYYFFKEIDYKFDNRVSLIAKHDGSDSLMTIIYIDITLNKPVY